MTFLLLLLVIGIWACLFFAGMSFCSWYMEKEKVRANLDHYIPPWKEMKQKSSRKDLLRRWMDGLAPTGRKIRILSDDGELEDLLAKAGYPCRLNVQRMHGAKILGAFAGFMLGFFWYLIGLPLKIIPAVFGPFMGYLAPQFIVRILARRRQEQIRYELPDFLDMMSITLSAGMSLAEALACYVEAADGPLSEELSRLNREIRFGVRRETAYRSLIRRTESRELESLIQSLIQAHNLGTPIAQTFALQAEEMRRMRAERAKEAAGKAAPKISLVSGLVIAPSIMLLMLAAIVYNSFIARDIFRGF